MADGQGEPKAWWVDGPFAPTFTEEHLADLEVEGALPPSLNGVFIRNGANPPSGKSGHWFMGEGMLHGVRLEGGRARWYRNRYVQTSLLREGKDPADLATMMDKTQSLANTSIVRHAGKLYALEEAHFPYEVSPDLETKGVVDFDGKLTTGFTAHPKVCPETGEMLAFGYQVFPPYVTYHRFSADGRLIQSVDIPMQGPTMVHEMAVTRRHAIFLDLPIVFDMAGLAAGNDMPMAWSDAYPPRVGVMPRDGDVSGLRWFDIQPCYIFHTLNAYEDGDEVVMDAARFGRIERDGKGDLDPLAYMWRYRFNLKTGAVSETQLHDVPGEFPRCDERLTGLPNRYGYGVELPPLDGAPPPKPLRLYKYDLKTGARHDAAFAHGVLLGEPVFAAGGPGEDEGYVMTFASLPDGRSAELVVLDAQDFAKAPIARVKIPRRVPMGFHGGFFPDEGV